MKPDLLQRALNRADIPPHIQREVLNEVLGKGKTPTDVEWRALLDRARHVRRMLMTNKSRWQPDAAPLYQRYTDILSVVIDKIEQARIEVLPDGAPVTIAQFTAQRAIVNKRRVQEGKRPLAVCGTRWQDWVPLHIRTELMRDAEQHYALAGALPGARFMPFITLTEKREHGVRVERIKSALKNITRACANMGTSPPMSDNLYGALHLAAARQAERALRRYSKPADMLDNPCPVNWLHLLEPNMRSRLSKVRRAVNDGEAFDIPLEWCRDFYMKPMREGVEPDMPILDADLFDSADAAGDIELEEEV